MPSENISTQAIINADANPPVRATSGKDGDSFRVTKLGYVTPTTGKTSGSVYRFARVPSNARNVSVEIEVNGTLVTLTGDVTIYFSDLGSDEVGIGQGDTGLVNSLSGAAALFATALAAGGQTAGAMVDVTNKAGNYTPDKRQKELWDAAGLTSDPGGFFDVAMLTTATNSFTAGATIAARVGFQAPYL